MNDLQLQTINLNTANYLAAIPLNERAGGIGDKAEVAELNMA